MHSRIKRGLVAATALTGVAIGALQIANAGDITRWRTFGHSEAHVRGFEGHNSINAVRSTTNRDPERLRFVVHAPPGVRVDPGVVRWSLFCWNEFDARDASRSGSFPLNEPIEVRNLSERVLGGVASYQFCELLVDARQGKRGNVETWLQARYP